MIASSFSFAAAVRTSLAVALLLGFGASAHAQLQVDLAIKRSLFIRFEPIIATVSITNLSGQALHLEDRPNEPWFGFSITREDGLSVPPRAAISGKDPIRIGAGETLRRQVNITPLYALDDFGSYQIRATVLDPVTGRSFASRPTKIEISEGRLLWQQDVGHPEEGTQRRLTLLVHRLTTYTALYLRIEDPDKGRVYCTHALGRFVIHGQPGIEIDSKNQIHILHLQAPKTHTYSHIGLNGEILGRASFVATKSTPRLARDAEGNVGVVGGQPFDPGVPAAEALTPGISERPAPMAPEATTPLPSPTPAKKSFWPFSKKTTPAQ